MSRKVALVTGASSGIGEATALRLHELGYTVHAAARRVERMAHLAERGIRPLAMDVTDEASVQAGVEQVLAESGRIDVLVNNAGYGSYGALEDVPLEEARYQFEVNVFGAARLTQLVLPQMRERRSGHIVNVSSMGGKIYEPLGGWYHATKFALEGLSDSLRLELKPFGIDVVIVEPGAIRTEWGGIAADNLRKVSGETAYAEQAAAGAAVLSSVEANPRLGSAPSVVADAIAKAVTARRPRTRYAIGMGAKPAILLRRILPDRAFDALVTTAFRATARRTPGR
ncbi:oxidoreductase [Kitasatospora atroaurantiaca]|uniref:Short-subunit dehydrogenase n=1 Tax=Kitasatospora atroaurantiaca TaxID=285545 RepID=A0A561F1G8_9ACTN|nr:oxidoreductase [Kitasatospora atroaurantiaca]TWE21715.1 short-subunit dehydrogenase [Kitasatospora atroaurantiaca]